MYIRIPNNLTTSAHLFAIAKRCALVAARLFIFIKHLVFKPNIYVFNRGSIGNMLI